MTSVAFDLHDSYGLISFFRRQLDRTEIWWACVGFPGIWRAVSDVDEMLICSLIHACRISWLIVVGLHSWSCVAALIVSDLLIWGCLNPTRLLCNWGSFSGGVQLLKWAGLIYSLRCWAVVLDSCCARLLCWFDAVKHLCGAFSSGLSIPDSGYLISNA